MAWTNAPLVLYHGTDNASIDARDHPSARGQVGTLGLAPNPSNIYIGPNTGRGVGRVRTGTEFGPGFYATTSEHQARQWANQGLRRALASGIRNQQAVVIRFEVDRDRLSRLESLSFVRDDPGFWDFVAWCRPRGRTSHNRAHNPNLQPWPEMYEVVHAPVTIWRQLLVLKDCDQISFHSNNAVQVLGVANWHDCGTPFF
jgi:Protein of unknown function (DUF3990)